MTKKDYQAIARAIYDETNMPYPGVGVVLSNVTRALADVFTADNPRFDRARFIEACATGHTKGMSR